MYVNPNFSTKKQLIEAVAADKLIAVFQPGPFSKSSMMDGEFSVEGPHYPKPHRWYARVLVKNSRVVKVIS